MSSRPSPEATEPKLSVDASGTIHLPPMSVPLSNLLSDEAKAGLRKYFRFLASQEDDDMFSLTTESDAVEEQRRRLAEHDAPKIQRLRELYPTEITPRTIAGVLVDVVTPKGGISSRNARRILIELHGGGFLFGARSCADSIPVASIGEITVLSVDYRQGPEHRFPAASEDVVAVYRELLESYEPQSIGIYGCSAGGVLTAEDRQGKAADARRARNTMRRRGRLGGWRLGIPQQRAHRLQRRAAEHDAASSGIGHDLLCRRRFLRSTGSTSPLR
jgi:epsilon-lactone hydrolase